MEHLHLIVVIQRDIVNLVLSEAMKKHGDLLMAVGICLSKEIFRNL